MRIRPINIKETVCMEFAALCSIFGMFITNICNNVRANFDMHVPVRLLVCV